MYEHRYKYGKQKDIMTVKEFRELLEKASGPLAHKAYCILLWHSGARKSELYERIFEDVRLSGELLMIDFHKRKKGGEEVEPLGIPRRFYGIEQYAIPYLRQPKRACKKAVFFQEDTGKTHTTKTGKIMPVMVTKSEVRKAKWLFPDIGSTTAWKIVKAVLGEKYYPHYCRLRKLSAAGRTAKNFVDMIDAVKSISGLKTIPAIAAYLGSDEKVRWKAMRESE